MPQHAETAKDAQGKMRRSLEGLAERLVGARSVRDGDVVMRLSGEGGGMFLLSCRGGKIEVVDTALAGGDRAPVLEVIGDAEAVRSIVDGEIEARKRFLAGGLRVRGDLRYLSDVALELGLLEAPL